MIERIFYLTIALLTFNSGITFAQISGISNSKVVVPGTETVGVRVFEFEPAFESFTSNSAWDSEGNLTKFDSSSTESAHGFRFTTGVKEDLEVGVILPSDVSSLNFGLKWLFMRKNDLSVALQTGINFDAAIGKYRNEERGGRVLGGGLVFTYEPGGKYSVDSDITVSFYSQEIDGYSVGHSGTFDIGVSYALSKDFQSVVEYNFNWITFENKIFDAEKGSGLVGFTFNASQLTKVIMGLKKDIHGTNNLKGVKFIAAFTFLI